MRCISVYTILYHIIIYYTILDHTILYYTILYCTVLYHVVAGALQILHELRLGPAVQVVGLGMGSFWHRLDRSPLLDIVYSS